MKSRMRKGKAKESILNMYCDSCGDTCPRWDLEIVVAEKDIQLMSDLSQNDFSFACPSCVEKLDLYPLQNEKANKFRTVNEQLRQTIQPQTIN